MKVQVCTQFLWYFCSHVLTYFSLTVKWYDDDVCIYSTKSIRISVVT